MSSGSFVWTVIDTRSLFLTDTAALVSFMSHNAHSLTRKLVTPYEGHVFRGADGRRIPILGQ